MRSGTPVLFSQRRISVNLVDLEKNVEKVTEKLIKTRIYLQTSVLIQPRTSPQKKWQELGVEPPGGQGEKRAGDAPARRAAARAQGGRSDRLRRDAEPALHLRGAGRPSPEPGPSLRGVWFSFSARGVGVRGYL